MNGQLSQLLSRLRESMGFALPAPPSGRPSAPPTVDYSLSVLTEALHAISMVGLSLLWRKSNDQLPLARASVDVVSDPSLENHVRFQSLLFPAHRDTFAQVFPVQYMGKDLLPLYLRKYLQVLEELQQIAKMPTQERQGKDLEQSLEYALTFLVNNWAGSLAILRPSARAPEGPSVEVLAGPAPTAKLRTLSHQIKPRALPRLRHGPARAPPPLLLPRDDEDRTSSACSPPTGRSTSTWARRGTACSSRRRSLMDLGDFLFRAGGPTTARSASTASWSRRTATPPSSSRRSTTA